MILTGRFVLQTNTRMKAMRRQLDEAEEEISREKAHRRKVNLLLKNFFAEPHMTPRVGVYFFISWTYTILIIGTIASQYWKMSLSQLDLEIEKYPLKIGISLKLFFIVMRDH